MLLSGILRMSLTKQQSGVILEPIQVGSGLEVPNKMCRMVSWDQLQNYLLPISSHVSGYIPEQWKGTKQA